MGAPLAKIVDGLLWLSPHAESLSMEYACGAFDKFHFKVLYIFHFWEVEYFSIDTNCVQPACLVY